MLRRTLLLGAGAAALGLASTDANAAYPDRMLNLIVPFDLATHVGRTAMALQPYLEHALRQHIELVPKSGADGELGHLLGAEAPADGYTLTMVSQSLAVQRWLTNASVAAPDNFTFVGQVTAVPNVLLVRADSTFATLEDLVAGMRASPDTLKTGGQPNWWPASALTRALFTSRAGVQPRIDEGYYTASGMLWALQAGQLDFAVVGVNDLHTVPATRQMRALAVSTERRLPALSGTPTFREQGWDIVMAWWHGVAVPKDTPADIVARLAAGLAAALDSPALVADFARNGLTVDPLDGPAMTRRVADEYQTIGALFTALGKNLRVRRAL